MKSFIALVLFFTISCNESADYTNTLACIEQLHRPGFAITLNPQAGTEEEQVAAEDERIIRYCFSKYKRSQLYNESIMKTHTRGVCIPLVTACMFNHPTIVTHFIHLGLPPIDRFERRYLRNAAQVAATKNHFSIVTALLPHLMTSEVIYETEGKSIFSHAFDAAQSDLTWKILRKNFPSDYLIRQRQEYNNRTWIDQALYSKKNHFEYDAIGLQLILVTRMNRETQERLLRNSDIKKFRPQTFQALALLAASTTQTIRSDYEKLRQEMEMSYGQ